MQLKSPLEPNLIKTAHLNQSFALDLICSQNFINSLTILYSFCRSINIQNHGRSKKLFFTTCLIICSMYELSSKTSYSIKFVYSVLAEYLQLSELVLQSKSFPQKSRSSSCFCFKCFIIYSGVSPFPTLLLGQLPFSSSIRSGSQVQFPRGFIFCTGFQTAHQEFYYFSELGQLQKTVSLSFFIILTFSLKLVCYPFSQAWLFVRICLVFSFAALVLCFLCWLLCKFGSVINRFKICMFLSFFIKPLLSALTNIIFFLIFYQRMLISELIFYFSGCLPKVGQFRFRASIHFFISWGVSITGSFFFEINLVFTQSCSQSSDSDSLSDSLSQELSYFGCQQTVYFYLLRVLLCSLDGFRSGFSYFLRGSKGLVRYWFFTCYV